MAEHKFPKGSPEWLMFQDYYKLCQKYWVAENADVYWKGIVADAGDFLKKYKEVPLAEGLYLAFVTTQEAKLK